MALFSAPSRADWSIDFVRITCLSEARYLQFESRSIDGNYVLLDTQDGKSFHDERTAAWEKKGYYRPSALTYECKLPDATYTIQASQPPPQASGPCGVSPYVTLTLMRDDRLVLDHVVFGPDTCYGKQGISVSSVEISDGLRGWDRAMTLCLLPEPSPCVFLSEQYKDISKAMPIDQESIVRYFRERQRASSSTQ
jgi:hypothetical protein